MLDAGTSSLASAAASTTASLVIDGLASDNVLEAMGGDMVEVDMTVVVEIAEVAIGISVSDPDSDIEVIAEVGVGPAVDMDVSVGVADPEVIDGVEVGISMSASEYSVGDPA